MSSSAAPVRRPRAARVATVTTLVLVALYVAGGFAARRIADDELAEDNLLGRGVLDVVRPFLGDPFTDFRVEEWLPWLAGVGAAAVTAWLICWLTARKGAMAAFAGAWLGALLAGAAGGLASARVWIDQQQLPAGSGVDLYLQAVDLGLRWALLFGWAPALVAALLAATLRTRPAEPEWSEGSDGGAADETEGVRGLRAADGRDDPERLPSLSLPAQPSSRG